MVATGKHPAVEKLRAETEDLRHYHLGQVSALGIVESGDYIRDIICIILGINWIADIVYIVYIRRRI